MSIITEEVTVIKDTLRISNKATLKCYRESCEQRGREFIINIIGNTRDEVLSIKDASPLYAELLTLTGGNPLTVRYNRKQSTITFESTTFTS